MRFNSVDLMLTTRCNLRCAFCYIDKHPDVTPENEVQRNIDTCNWIVNQYRTAPSTNPNEQKQVNINLYGGEPTVAWDSVVALVNWRKSITDVEVKMGLVTNMVLMDSDRIDWCLANNISISPSIDGCKEVEDMFRITEKGETVSDVVFANAKILNARSKARHCRSTLSPATVPYMFKSMKFLTEELGFEQVNQILAGGVGWKDEDIEVAKQQTTLITDWWIENMRKKKHYSIYYIRNMLGGIWTPTRKRGLCSAGCGMGAVDTNGNIYPCHRFCNDSTPAEYTMGNIHTGGVVNKVLEDKLKNFDLASYHKEKCSTCIAVNSCMALCIHEMMLAGNGMFEPLPHYCKMWKFYYTEAMRAHAIMDAEKNQLYYSLYRPRPQQANVNNQVQQQITQLQQIAKQIQQTQQQMMKK